MRAIEAATIVDDAGPALLFGRATLTCPGPGPDLPDQSENLDRNLR